jgi:hypothetical protein
MSEQPKIYKLTDRPQLIDLNADLVNFDLEFLVKSTIPNKEFNAIVLTQQQIDVIDINKIDMKKAQGQISGNINANNNKYQNYFLILKKLNNSDEEIDVEVITKLTKIDVSENDSSNISSMSSIISNDVKTPEEIIVVPTVIPFYKKFYFWVFIIILIGICLFLYFKVYKKKSNSINPTAIDTNDSSELYNKLTTIATENN